MSNRTPRGRSTPTRRWLLASLTAGFLAAGAISPALAGAHGLSGRAGLPVPAWLFAWAAAAVLVISFVLLSTMWPTPRLQEPREARVCSWPGFLSVPAGAIGRAA